MKQDFDGESRLRRFAQAFRREANPRADLAGALMSGARQGTTRNQGPFAMLPAVAMAGGVILAAIVIAFGAVQLRTLGHKSPTPPIVLPTPTPTVSPEATPSPSPSVTPTPSPSVAPSGVVPQGIPGLTSMQMVGPHLGWAVGSHAIYTTGDGAHWTKQYSSTEDFVGVDFISTTTGWVVGGQSLLGTSDGGRSWQQLGEATQWIRSVHFVNTTQGWGIAGGNELIMHGVLIPGSGGTLVVSNDGGRSWTNLNAPHDPQSVCFSDSGHGWLATQAGTVYRSGNGGQTWSQVLQMAKSQPGLSGWARIECAAPSALWVQWAPGGAAAGHSPYVVYATTNATTWRTVMAEPGTIGNQLPGVPPGPGSYPGSFSVVDPSDAVFVGDTPPANAASTMIATNGGATLKSTGQIAGAFQTFDAAFVSTTAGWVLAVDDNGHDVIVATTDGGYHWSQELAVAR
jgi:Photosynthesis system II assembly factor YCF48